MGSPRKIVFTVSAAAALAALSMLSLGGFLTMEPALISNATAEALRTTSISIFAVSGLLALATAKPQWLRQIQGH